MEFEVEENVNPTFLAHRVEKRHNRVTAPPLRQRILKRFQGTEVATATI